MEKSSMGSTLIDNSKNSSKVVVNDCYVIQSVILTLTNCQIYRGIDISSHTFVTIYVRLYSTENNNIVTGIKQQLKQKISPPIKWAGSQKIGKHLYQIEVHQKYGPSLDEIFSLYKNKITVSTFYLLIYQLIKLVQKVSIAGYVCHDLNLKNIVVHPEPEKNQLYLLNTLEVKKKNQQCLPMNHRYCSISAHLGLKACGKDDLEAIFYIMLDIYTRGKFWGDTSDYLQFKNTLKISNLPELPSAFVDFYIYTRNLNHTDQINFSHWKAIFKKRIMKSTLVQPYQWITNSKIKKQPIIKGQFETQSIQKSKSNIQQTIDNQSLFTNQKDQFSDNQETIQEKIGKFISLQLQNQFKLKKK